MTEIHTEHENDEKGDQQTYRTVTITDAKGDSFDHRFRETDDGHEYLGEGQPPESAVEALEEFESDPDE